MARNLYVIGIRTGDAGSAGTNGDVLVTLHGENKSSSPLNLDNRAGNFEQGNMDLFPVSIDDLGRINSITIGCTDSGWFFDYAIVAQYPDIAEEFQKTDIDHTKWRYIIGKGPTKDEMLDMFRKGIVFQHLKSVEGELQGSMMTGFTTTHEVTDGNPFSEPSKFTDIYEYGGWINKDGQGQRTLYARAYNKDITFTSTGQTEQRLFSRTWQFNNNSGNEMDLPVPMSMSAGKNVIQTNEKTKETSFSESATVTIGGQGEIINASASVTAAFQQKKAELERQANESMIHAESSFEFVVPKGRYGVAFAEWDEIVEKSTASYGFSSTNAITYPVGFQLARTQTISAKTIHELFAKVEPGLAMDLYTVLNDQYHLFRTQKGKDDYLKIAQDKSQEEIQ